MLRKFASRVAHNEDELIFEPIACGCTMAAIARDLGCSRGMLYSFFKTSKTRQEKFAVARRISADSHAEAGLQILDEVAERQDLTNAEVMAANSRARYRRWLAAVCDPTRYSQRLKTTQEVDIGQLHLDALRKSGRMQMAAEGLNAED